MLKSLSSTLGKWRSGKYSFRDISHGIKILKVKVSLPGNLHMLASFFSGLAETHVGMVHSFKFLDFGFG